MEKIYHPVSGEPMYAYTEEENKLVKLALKNLESSSTIGGCNHEI